MDDGRQLLDVVNTVAGAFFTFFALFALFALLRGVCGYFWLAWGALVGGGGRGSGCLDIVYMYTHAIVSGGQEMSRGFLNTPG